MAPTTLANVMIKNREGSGKGAGNLDLYVEGDGEVVVTPKGGRGPGEPVGANLHDLKENASKAAESMTPSTYDLKPGNDGWYERGWVDEPWLFEGPVRRDSVLSACLVSALVLIGVGILDG